MPVDPGQYAVWLQVARLQDYAMGVDGKPRSEMDDSPLGRDLWFSEAARKSASRSDDLAAGYAQLIAMRVDILGQGLPEAVFVRTALEQKPYGPLYRFILENYLEYDLANL